MDVHGLRLVFRRLRLVAGMLLLGLDRLTLRLGRSRQRPLARIHRVLLILHHFEYLTTDHILYLLRLQVDLIRAH